MSPAVGRMPRTAPGAPASGPAGVEFSQKRAGSEIGAPLLPSESEAVCGCAPAVWFVPTLPWERKFRSIWTPAGAPELVKRSGAFVQSLVSAVKVL